LGLCNRVAKCFSQLVNRRIDAVLELNYSVVRPKSFSDLLAADQGTLILDEDAQYLERLLLEQDGRASGA
jgi:hypothetical protein